jgi:hypothetical protein
MGSSPGYREELRAVLADMLEGRPDATGAHVRLPGLLYRGQACGLRNGTGLGLRLPREQATELRGRPSRAFEPYGRTMRAWTFLEPAAPEELRAERAVLDAAIDRAKRDGGAT